MWTILAAVVTGLAAFVVTAMRGDFTYRRAHRVRRLLELRSSVNLPAAAAHHLEEMITWEVADLREHYFGHKLPERDRTLSPETPSMISPIKYPRFGQSPAWMVITYWVARFAGPFVIACATGITAFIVVTVLFADVITDETRGPVAVALLLTMLLGLGILLTWWGMRASAHIARKADGRDLRSRDTTHATAEASPAT